MNFPSVSKCTGTDCKKKEECFRYVKPPLEKYQSWLTESVAIPNKDQCKFFMIIEEK